MSVRDRGYTYSEEEIMKQVNEYSDDAILSRKNKLEKIPILGGIFKAGEDILGPEVQFLVDVYKEVEDIYEVGKSVITKGMDFINGRENANRTGQVDVSQNTPPTLSQQNIGYTAPIYNYKSAIAYANSDQKHSFAQS